MFIIFHKFEYYYKISFKYTNFFIIFQILFSFFLLFIFIFLLLFSNFFIYLNKFPYFQDLIILHHSILKFLSVSLLLHRIIYFSEIEMLIHLSKLLQRLQKKTQNLVLWLNLDKIYLDNDILDENQTRAKFNYNLGSLIDSSSFRDIFKKFLKKNEMMETVLEYNKKYYI